MTEYGADLLQIRTLAQAYRDTYPRMAFEADLAAIESTAGNQPCSVLTGVGCTRRPVTDDGTPAAFYPFYTKGHTRDGCRAAQSNTIRRRVRPQGGSDHCWSMARFQECPRRS